jgi:Rrf2 family protein
MAPLVRQHLVLATAGPDGGYELARPPASITLLEVIEAAEGPLVRERCLLQGGPCDWEQVCPAHDVWSQAHEALGHQLRITTFKQLGENDQLIEQGAFDLPVLPLHPVSVARLGQRES